MALFASILPDVWREMLCSCSQWSVKDKEDERLDLDASTDGWKVWLVRKTWLCRSHAYVVVQNDADDVHHQEQMLASMWYFARRLMFSSAGCDYLFSKRSTSSSSKDHRMLVAVAGHKVILVDVRIQREQEQQVLCRLEILTEESRNMLRMEHLFMEGPLASWYHPCCNQWMTGTCEEAIDIIQQNVIWECVEMTPPLQRGKQEGCSSSSSWDDVSLAFAMSQHPRLGADATVPGRLDCHILKQVFAMAKGQGVPPAMNTFELLDWLACHLRMQ